MRNEILVLEANFSDVAFLTLKILDFIVFLLYHSLYYFIYRGQFY